MRTIFAGVLAVLCVVYAAPTPKRQVSLLSHNADVCGAGARCSDTLVFGPTFSSISDKQDEAGRPKSLIGPIYDKGAAAAQSKQLEHFSSAAHTAQNTTTTLLQLVNSRPELRDLSRLVNERDVLVAALSAAGADLTLFAPTDEALGAVRRPPPDSAVTQLLLYHIATPATPLARLVDGALIDTAYAPAGLGGAPQKIRVSLPPGGIARLNGVVPVDTADLSASNGVMHTIGRILIPPPNALWTLAHAPLEFAAFLLALNRVDLADTIKTTATLTIFAPTNTAFKKLGFRRLRYLFSNQGKQKLHNILTYHVSPQLVYTPSIITAGDIKIPTLYHDKQLHVVVKTHDDEHDRHHVIEINRVAHIDFADIVADNGVVHAIDSVLVPFKWRDVDTDVDDVFNSHHAISAEADAVLDLIFKSD